MLRRGKPLSWGHWDDKTDILLCSMPFGLVVTPSLALGLLQGSITGSTFRVRQLYFSLRFLRIIGYAAYRTIAERWEAGDWIFTQALFPDQHLNDRGFIDEVLRKPSPDYECVLSGLPEERRRASIEGCVAACLEARRAAPEFLDACLREIQNYRPRLVGFSCLFQQRVASLALARSIKEQDSGTFVLFGGAECNDVAGLEMLRQFPFVDAVVSGPGDVVFREIADRVRKGEPVEGIQGVYTGSTALAGNSVPVTNAAPPDRLDDLPYPVFDDYFSEVEALGITLPVQDYISLETSRGCWWGENGKRHCIFCGLNGGSLRYSAKSSARMLAEIEHFATKCPGKPIIMTDSILNMEYFACAIPALAEGKLNAEIQYETRATLTRVQLESLRAAGIIQIQPGIESLSTPILKLMRKGITALQAVQLLKWAGELGFRVLWNLLGGFPSEPPEQYRAMETLIPLLTHLPPPARFRYVTLVRKSPLFENAGARGVTGVRPADAYSYIFPFERSVTANLATTFRFQVPEGVEEYTAGLREAVRRWKLVHEQSRLVVIGNESRAIVLDQRPVAKAKLVPLEGLESFVHAACDRIRSLVSLQRLASAAGYDGGPIGNIERILQDLGDKGLIVRENNLYLALAQRVPAPNERERPSGTATECHYA